MAGQDVEPGDRPGTWRIARRTAPDRVVSVVDPESRHTHKTSHSYRDGYKAHIATEPETGLVTDCDLTAGNTGDADAAPGLVSDEPEGTEVLGDSAYGTGEFRDHLASANKTATIKPPPLRPAVPGGFTLDDFGLDDVAGTLTCPAGVVVTLTTKGRADFGANCSSCPLRRLCTTARDGRVVVLNPHHRLLAAARVRPPPTSSTPCTGDGGRWSSAAWPGSPGAPTAKSATSASSATGCGVAPLCRRQPPAPPGPRSRHRSRRGWATA